MDDFITQTEILSLLGKSATNANKTLHNMINRGKLEGFPKPLKQRYRRQTVYSKARVLEYLNGNNQNKVNLAFEFLTGKYAPFHLQTKWILNKMRAKQNKPKTVTVKVAGEW